MTDELKAWAEEQAYERAKAEYMEKLNEIRAEIEQIELLARYTRGDIKQMALDIIDKYRDKEQKDNGFFDEIMDDESDGEVYEKIKEIIAKVKEQERNQAKCHTCKHYLQGEYDGSCGSYICKNYSGWEDKEQKK